MLLPTSLALYTAVILAVNPNGISSTTESIHNYTPSTTVSAVTAVVTTIAQSGGLARSLDFVDSVQPPVLTDSLFLGWHLALAHIYGNLLIHPEFQELPGLAPLLRGNANELGWGPGGCRSLQGPTAKERAAALQRAYVAGFPVDSVAQTISQTPALDEAVRSAHITPGEFAALTSVTQQTLCAKVKLGDIADTLYWPVNATLGKNLVYLYDNKKGLPKNLWGRVENWGLNRLQSGGSVTLAKGKSFDYHDAFPWHIDCYGKEYPVTKDIGMFAESCK